MVTSAKGPLLSHLGALVLLVALLSGVHSLVSVVQHFEIAKIKGEVGAFLMVFRLWHQSAVASL